MKKERESGIEMLKILAMLLIVTSHVLQTLGDTENAHYVSTYVLDFSVASVNIQSVVLAWMQCFGAWGNLLFFVSSAWFLLENDKSDPKKVFHMAADVWIINFIILIILEVCGCYDISVKDLIKSLLPNIFAANWYITCYMLFYLIHGKLNQIVRGCAQRELLGSVLVMLSLYYGIVYVKGDLLFSNNLILWIVAYFAVAYMKFHLPDFCQCRKWNFLMLGLGLAGTLAMVLITNFLGLRISVLEDQLTRWASNASPFLLATSIAMFNLFRGKRFVNPVINRISGLSLLVYIIHENLLLRQYVRPQMWIFVHETFGYDYVILWVLVMAAGIFIWALCMAALYRMLLQKSIHKLAEKIFSIASMLSNRLMPILLRIK